MREAPLGSGIILMLLSCSKLTRESGSFVFGLVNLIYKESIILKLSNISNLSSLFLPL